MIHSRSMVHTYKIHGMHCEACVSKIETALKAVDGVSSVKAHLNIKEAVIGMNHHVELPVLNETLKKAGNYQLADWDESRVEVEREQPGQFLPLLVVFTVIIGFTYLRQLFSYDHSTVKVMHDFMGAFFILFGGLKLLDWPGFAEAYSTYDLLAKRSRLYAFLYPLIELGLGVCYLLDWHVIQASWVTLILMTFGSIGVAKALLSGKKIQCACLGTKIKLPMTKITLMEDLLMAFMAAVMIFIYKS